MTDFSTFLPDLDFSLFCLASIWDVKSINRDLRSRDMLQLSSMESFLSITFKKLFSISYFFIRIDCSWVVLNFCPDADFDVVTWNWGFSTDWVLSGKYWDKKSSEKSRFFSQNCLKFTLCIIYIAPMRFFP